MTGKSDTSEHKYTRTERFFLAARNEYNFLRNHVLQEKSRDDYVPVKLDVNTFPDSRRGRLDSLSLGIKATCDFYHQCVEAAHQRLPTSPEEDKRNLRF